MKYKENTIVNVLEYFRLSFLHSTYLKKYTLAYYMENILVVNIIISQYEINIFVKQIKFHNLSDYEILASSKTFLKNKEKILVNILVNIILFLLNSTDLQKSILQHISQRNILVFNIIILQYKIDILQSNYILLIFIIMNFQLK